ncbi:uncharacterized protein LOC132712786, partial [Ruditapes philippinarum]|uniref:uncharacterized protein LOC132712786 n=1 Tax=Ruditapes philippinarum TaxID=129788 RepID=UPI00295AF21B
MAKNKTINEQEHPASETSGYISVGGQSHSASVSQKAEDYQSVSSKDVSSVMRRWGIETPITDPLCDSQCVSASITDMCSICAAKGIGKIATHICRDCSQYGRYYCQRCWDYHNKFLPSHDTLSLSVSSDSNQCGSVKSIKAASNGDDQIKMWLNELKQQIEKDEYNDKAFDKKPNGNSESANLSVILKEICSIIQRRSTCQSNQGGSVKSIKAASNGDDQIKMWLNELKQQIEKDEYNDKAFDKKPNGYSESANLSVILKEICSIIQRRSTCQ